MAEKIKIKTIPTLKFKMKRKEEMKKHSERKSFDGEIPSTGQKQ